MGARRKSGKPTIENPQPMLPTSSASPRCEQQHTKKQPQAGRRLQFSNKEHSINRAASQTRIPPPRATILTDKSSSTTRFLPLEVPQQSTPRTRTHGGESLLQAGGSGTIEQRRTKKQHALALLLRSPTSPFDAGAGAEECLPAHQPTPATQLWLVVYCDWNTGTSRLYLSASVLCSVTNLRFVASNLKYWG